MILLCGCSYPSPNIMELLMYKIDHFWSLQKKKKKKRAALLVQSVLWWDLCFSRLLFSCFCLCNSLKKKKKRHFLDVLFAVKMWPFLMFVGNVILGLCFSFSFKVGDLGAIWMAFFHHSIFVTQFPSLITHHFKILYLFGIITHHSIFFNCL